MEESSSHNSAPINESIHAKLNIDSTPSLSATSSNPQVPRNDDTPTTIDCVDAAENVGDSSLHNNRLKSIVWDHFTKKKINSVDRAVCNYCKRDLGGDSKNGTKHLHDHLKRCPRRKTIELKQKVLTKNFLRGEGQEKMMSYSFNQEIARKELAYMIIMHEYPLSMVDHVGFKRYSNALQPLFKSPTRNTLRNDILKIFDYEKTQSMKLLEKNESRVAITTDMWTSSNQKKGFMAITAHFIDGTWNLQSRILRFAYVPCPHTKDVLCEVLIECLMDWNMDTKLSTITVDNCSTNDAMMDVLRDKLPMGSMLMSSSLIHMRCCAHILNLIVKDGLEVIKEGIEKIRESVAYWTATPKREEKFEETARQLRVPHSKKLVLDCPTRWNSTYLMLDTALLYKDVFCRLKQREPQYKIFPSEREWEFAKEICGRLYLFYSVTELFSGTKYPTANLYFSKICAIKLELCQWLTCSVEIVQQMALSMLTKFNKYWDDVHGMMGVAAVLDPRYKMELLEFYFSKLYGNDFSMHIDKIQHLLEDLVREYQVNFNENKHDSETPSSTSHHTIASGHMNDYNLFVRSRKKARAMNVRTELELYLADEVLPNNGDFDILLWWKVHGVKYPILRAIARDLLVIPISTVASESAFSTSGRLISPHRSRLHPKIVEALMCAQNWLWATMKKDGESAASGGYVSYLEDIDVDDTDLDKGSLTVSSEELLPDTSSETSVSIAVEIEKIEEPHGGFQC